MSNVAVQREYEVESTPVRRPRAEARIMKGIGASSGVVVGPCRVISKHEDLARIEKGEIVVTKTASPVLVPVMKRMAGLVSEVGGRLTTVALYARELGIPHVAGVADVLGAVTDGQIIRIDGSKGTVTLL